MFFFLLLGSFSPAISLPVAEKKIEYTNEVDGSFAMKNRELLLFQEPSEYSQVLFSLKCLDWILEGSDLAYEKMTQNQSPSFRLKKQSFLALHMQAEHLLQSLSLLPSCERKQLLQAAILLRWLKASEHFSLSFKLKDRNDMEWQKDFLLLLEEKASLFPSFTSLSTESRQFLLSSSFLANYDAIAALEGGREMFFPLKEKRGLQKEPKQSLDFDLFAHLCYRAGVSYSQKEASSALTEEAYLAFQISSDGCHLLLLPNKKEEDAYLLCIKNRASLLHLELKKSPDYSMVRIASLLGLFSSQEGEWIKEIFHKDLSYAQREFICSRFHPSKISSATSISMSHLLKTIYNDPVSGNSPHEKLKKTILLGLPLLSQILKDYQERIQLGLIDAQIPLNFKNAVKFVKESPLDIEKASYQIDKEGQVFLFIPKEVSKNLPR